KKGFYGSWPQLGAPLGLVLGTLVFSIFSAILTDEQFVAWGWRLPFLFSIVLVIVGLWIRFTLAESPEFQKVKDTRQEARRDGYRTAQAPRALTRKSVRLTGYAAALGGPSKFSGYAKAPVGQPRRGLSSFGAALNLPRLSLWLASHDATD